MKYEIWSDFQIILTSHNVNDHPSLKIGYSSLGNRDTDFKIK